MEQVTESTNNNNSNKMQPEVVDQNIKMPNQLHVPNVEHLGMGPLGVGLESYSSTSYSGLSVSESSSHNSPPGGDIDGDDDDRSGYLNDYCEIESHRHRRNSLETVDTNMSVLSEDYAFLEKYPKLPDLDKIPWNDQEVLNVLRNGRTKHLSGHITVEMMQRLAYLLQRPLVRIARETKRLSCMLMKCTKHEVQSSVKIVLAQALSDSCLQACAKALALYCMSGDTLKQSKSSRCGLYFSVGKFHRWLLDSHVGLRVHEYAAIYFAASMENLLEEITLRALAKEELGDNVLSLDALETGINCNSELWGLLQPYEHIICGRNASGVLSLPSCVNVAVSDRVKGRRAERQQTTPAPPAKNLEQCLLATCVGSKTELGDLVTKAVAHLNNNKGCIQSSSPIHKFHPVSLSTEGLNTLYYYMQCSQLEHADNPNSLPPSVHIQYERPYAVQPPLVEWLRVSSSHTEHRYSWVMDEDDIKQTARLLLPGIDCPPRAFRPDESLSMSKCMDPPKCAVKFQQDLAYRMLSCGRPELVKEALSLLGKNKANTVNEQGLTPLMYSCLHGDEAMVTALLNAKADVNITVPSDMQKYPCVHPDTKHWTALTFAAASGNLTICQRLIESGATIEGAKPDADENCTETPLQLAASSGHYDLVTYLLSKGADPYMNTVPKNGVSFTYNRGGYNAFNMAAAHGQRNVLRRLLAEPTNTSNEVLSLEEMLEEGKTSPKHKPNMTSLPVPTQTKIEIQESTTTTLIEDYQSTGNEYMTIDDALCDDSNKKQEDDNKKTGACAKLTKSQFRTWQEALFQAAENGYLDICLDLRNMGIPWTIHSWGKCLEAAMMYRRKSLVQHLLSDFKTCNIDEVTASFVSESLPLLFTLVQKSKSNECNSMILAEILSSLYGSDPIVPIPELRNNPPARIDPHFVNNPELSDVQFIVEEKVFYAHKIILVNASNRFRAMLSKKFCEGNQPTIELNDVRFKIFEYMMHFLYNGGPERLHVDSKDVLELMGAANFFMLDGLQRHCEILLSRRLNADNSTAIYKHGKLFAATELLTYCEAYYLQNLRVMLSDNESFRKMIYSAKRQNYDLIGGLLNTLSQKILDRIQCRKNRTCVSPMKNINTKTVQLPVSQPQLPVAQTTPQLLLSSPRMGVNSPKLPHGAPKFESSPKLLQNPGSKFENMKNMSSSSIRTSSSSGIQSSTNSRESLRSILI